MTTIDHLLWPEFQRRLYSSTPEMDPLSENDALQEAQLLDVRFDAVRSTAGLLFELRSALQLKQANTGVMILRGVRELSWTSGLNGAKRTAWAVGGSTVAIVNELFAMELGLWPDANLTLIAQSASFVVGDVPELDSVPDYVEDNELKIRSQLASWQSSFVPVSGVSLNPKSVD